MIAEALDKADSLTAVALELAAFAGLRRSEIARVHSNDLTSHGDLWTLRVEGKGGTIREIPLLPQIAHHILDASPLGGGWLFPGKHGHITPSVLAKRATRYLANGWTLHTLRHRFATRAYDGQRDIRAVQNLLGHTSIATTQRYVAIPYQAMRQAVEHASTLAETTARKGASPEQRSPSA